MSKAHQPLRARIRAGAPVLGIFCAIPDPVAVEITAATGYDMICIDGEHTQISRGTLEGLLRAAEITGTPAMVRIPQLADEYFSACLDAGAQGVLVPRVSTPEQARDAVQAMRYPPLGRRGVGPGRASGYGRRIGEHLAEANENLCLALQIETVQAVSNIDAILQTKGIDMVFIGPGDLGVSLAAAGQPGQVALDAAIARIINAAQAADPPCPVGLFVPDDSSVAHWLAQGVRCLIIGSDASELCTTLDTRLQAARAAAGTG